MKILHVNASDINGGAARAAYRVHRALIDAGVSSNMLVQSKFSNDETVLAPYNSPQKLINKMRPKLDSLPLFFYPNRTKTLFSPAWLPFSQIPKKVNKINPDIVHLHWICAGMMRIEDLLKIKAPIVWSMHDMWALTGGEHCDEEQEHYIDSCGSSVVLNSKNKKDLSYKGWKRKSKVYNKISNFTIIQLSRWMHSCALKSSLLHDKRNVYIPNLINTKTYAPIDKKTAREILGLNINKKIVLFGAMSPTSDPNKGYEYLKGALKMLTADIEFMIFGGNSISDNEINNIKINNMGRLHDDVSLRLLYSAADVMVVPSKQENLSNTIMESLACSTPVVAFNIGGNGDMIEHKINGYLARAFDVADLAYGIEWILNSVKYESLCHAARTKIKQTFEQDIVIEKYIQLYKDILAL